jgi:hypothetical protein
MPQHTIKTAIEVLGEDFSPIQRHCPPPVPDALPRPALQRLPLHALGQLRAWEHLLAAIEEWFCKPKVGSSILSTGTT